MGKNSAQLRYAEGVISTQNLVPAGIATPLSAVEIDVEDMSALGVQMVGTYTGALSLQATINGSTWVTVGGNCLLNSNSGAASATIPSATQGLFEADVSGFKKARITALAAVTGSVAVTLRGDDTANSMWMTTALPGGNNLLGFVQQLPIPASSGSDTAYNLESTAGTNINLVANATRRIHRLVATNTSGTTKYLKIYNKASTPVLASDTPYLTIPIPAGGTVNLTGLKLSTGIGIAITGAALKTDTTAVAAGDVYVSIVYA